jgi:hypothetical protein
MKVGNIELNEGGLGGWKLCNIPANKLPQRLATALVKVNEDLLGASFLPIRVVGKQVVNGINYMVLCKEVRATAKKDTRIVSLVINIPAGDITGEQATIVEVKESAELPDEVQDVFDAAIGSLHGVNYVPLLYVGEQVVKGLNYYVICEATVVYPDAVPKPVLVCVNTFNGVNSVVSIEQIYPFDLPADENVGAPLGEWP